MRSSLGFLTILGGAAAPSTRAARWFAPVGVLLGAAVGAAWWGADRLWPPLLAAILVVAVDAALTGMLHLDGVADSGDGLLAPMDRDRRLEVLRDPAIGAFGLVTLLSVVLLRVGSLAALEPDIVLLAGLWGASRGFMAVALATVPYARADGGGLAGSFGPGRDRIGLWFAAAGTVGALILVVVARGGLAGPATAGALLVGASGVVLLAMRRLGGFTGDILGCAGVVGETCGLLVAAAEW